MTSKKSTKKCDASAKLLFCQSKTTGFFAVLIVVVVAYAPY